MLKLLCAALLALAVAIPAWAQTPPVGQNVVSSGRQARLLTKSDTTVIPRTLGLYIGDAAACAIAVLFAGDTSPVTLANALPGTVYPWSVTKLMSANTTCTAVTAIY